MRQNSEKPLAGIAKAGRGLVGMSHRGAREMIQ